MEVVSRMKYLSSNLTNFGEASNKTYKFAVKLAIH